MRRAVEGHNPLSEQGRHPTAGSALRRLRNVFDTSTRLRFELVSDRDVAADAFLNATLCSARTPDAPSCDADPGSIGDGAC